MKLKRKTTDNQWVLLEEGYPHTVLLTENEAQEMKQKLQMMHPHLEYKVFYDAYYEFIDYYSDTEKEQINRLIP
jgi:hypothetical protein